MMFALGFVSLFVTGGISGIFLGQPALDLYFHDTYFVVGHFHMIMGVAAIFGMFAGTFYWFPKMFGKHDERDARARSTSTARSSASTRSSRRCTSSGMAGNPRRYSDFTNVEYLAGLMPVHKFMTHAAYFTAAVQILFLINLFWSMWKGPKAPDESVELDVARVDHPLAAAVRQFRRRASGGESRSVRIQRPGRAEGLHHADRPAFPAFHGIAHPYGYGWVTHTRCHSRAAASAGRRRLGRRWRRRSDGRGAFRRASFTGLYVLLAASTMLFAAFTSAMVVRRGLERRLVADAEAADPAGQHRGAAGLERGARDCAPRRSRRAGATGSTAGGRSAPRSASRSSAGRRWRGNS